MSAQPIEEIHVRVKLQKIKSSRDVIEGIDPSDSDEPLAYMFWRACSWVHKIERRAKGQKAKVQAHGVDEAWRRASARLMKQALQEVRLAQDNLRKSKEARFYSCMWDIEHEGGYEVSSLAEAVKRSLQDLRRCASEDKDMHIVKVRISCIETGEEVRFRISPKRLMHKKIVVVVKETGS